MLWSPPVNDLVRFALVAFYPTVDDLPGLADLDVDAHIASLRRETTLFMWVGIVAAAVLFQITPILTVRRPWLAVSLTDDELDAHAHALSNHPAYLIRQLILLLKLFGGIFWAEAPEVRQLLNLPPYPPDPGTRRTEAHVSRPEPGDRAPLPVLVALGRREQALGRGIDHYDEAVGKGQ